MSATRILELETAAIQIIHVNKPYFEKKPNLELKKILEKMVCNRYGPSKVVNKRKFYVILKTIVLSCRRKGNINIFMR